MKIALFMIMCSGIANQCLEPYKLNTHDTFYNCMINGYEEAIRKTKEIGNEEINKNKIYIKFVCAPDTEAKKGTGV
jgi:hypothetical protein